MKFEDWEPVYEAILADFGYSRDEDERARDVVAKRAQPFAMDRLAVANKVVAIAGGAACLEQELSLVRQADVVFAASTAADTLLAAGLQLDCVITDLDKRPDTAQALSHEGVPIAVHAHGDNIPALLDYLPGFTAEQVLPTTQAAPVGPVRNFGGFTDGDRAAFLADHLNADRLLFPGWDFDDPSVSAEKRRKLTWAERLLYWLERRRGDRFAVLDNRRAQIDTRVVPD